MTLLAKGSSAPTTGPVLPQSRRTVRDERRRLERHDVLASRLAELARMRVLLADADAVVGEGWVQHAWFRYLDEAGRVRLATAWDLDRVTGRPVVGACLVGGLVQAGGGPSAVSSQLFARALDLTWHTLYEGTARPVNRVPSPTVRTAHVQDLTRWNDASGRSAAEVRGLLGATATVALVESGRLREEQATL